jgi:hypothetical protein
VNVTSAATLLIERQSYPIPQVVQSQSIMDINASAILQHYRVKSNRAVKQGEGLRSSFIQAQRKGNRQTGLEYVSLH